MKTSAVSVVICTFNEAPLLEACLDACLHQTIKPDEVLVLDDCSTDRTTDVISTFKNKINIRYYKRPHHSGNMANLRNETVSLAKGHFLFFTDSDCVPDRRWIEAGLRVFRSQNVAAIEGKIIYNKSGYKPTLSDRTVSNLHGKLWMTANMAYRKSLFNKFKFNNTFSSLEDRELALQITREFPIPFVPAFKVYHQKKTRGILQYLKATNRYIQKVRLIKYHNDKIGSPLRVLNPQFLFILFFPPIILVEIAKGRVKTWSDIKLLPFIWVKSIYMRYLIWKTAITERVFVI